MRKPFWLLLGTCFLTFAAAACVEIGTDRDDDDAGISDKGDNDSDAGTGGAGGGDDSDASDGSDSGDSDAEAGHIPAELVGTWSISTSGEYVSGRSEYVFASAGTYTVSTLLDTKTECIFTHTEGVANAVGNQLTLAPSKTQRRKSADCEATTPFEDVALAEPKTYTWEIREEDSWTFLDLTDDEMTVSLSKDD